MRSTGEVLGMAESFGQAFFKAQEAASATLPESGTVLLSVAGKERPELLETARAFKAIGFGLMATQGTQVWLAENGIECKPVLKLHEGRPNIVDAIKNGEIQLVINTPIGKQSQHDDSYIRKNAIKYRIPYITTLAAALAAAEGIKAAIEGKEPVKSLQEFHRAIL
jgi:carbamoyl-phosphate synthase large subunit